MFREKITLSSKHKCCRLAQEIEKILATGILLRNKVIDYINSTFSNPSPRELEIIINDEANCEKDALLDLIFFPDVDLQCRLEPWLQKYDFSADDLPKVKSCMRSKNLETTIWLPQCRQPIKYQMPDPMIDSFLTRLNIDAKIKPGIIRSVHENISEPDRIPVLVQIRNAGTLYGGGREVFLRRFFETMSSGDDWREDLDFILEFLNEINGRADIYKALVTKKINCIQQLKRVEAFEEKTRKVGVEALLISGARVPTVDRSEMLKIITAVDRISIRIFGTTDVGNMSNAASENGASQFFIESN